MNTTCDKVRKVRRRLASQRNAGRIPALAPPQDDQPNLAALGRRISGVPAPSPSALVIAEKEKAPGRNVCPSAPSVVYVHPPLARYRWARRRDGPRGHRRAACSRYHHRYHSARTPTPLPPLHGRPALSFLLNVSGTARSLFQYHEASRVHSPNARIQTKRQTPLPELQRFAGGTQEVAKFQDHLTLLYARTISACRPPFSRGCLPTCYALFHTYIH